MYIRLIESTLQLQCTRLIILTVYNKVKRLVGLQ